MKIMMVGLMALAGVGLGAASLTPGDAAEVAIQEQQSQSDVDMLYALVQQTRADLAALRARAGLTGEGEEGGESGHAEGREGREGREAGHAEGREGREGREGGHAEGREGGREGVGEGGEEAGTLWGKVEESDMTYDNGARLILAYNPTTEAFEGTVQNTNSTVLDQVRVEVHLSSGVELGPTRRVDLKPGQTIPVALSAIGYEFSTWVTHPEAGVEEGHGAEGEEGVEGHGEGEESGEHGAGGEGGGNRPQAGNLRPLYNQLQLLRGEIKALTAALLEEKRG